MTDSFFVRAAKTSDVSEIREILEPWAARGIMLGKEQVELFESVQEFVVAESQSGEILGCGALHVMWEDLAEVRTLVVRPEAKGTGIGHAILEKLLERAQQLGIRRVFCLTFEVQFFASHGFSEISNQPIDQEIFAEMIRSTDQGIAEFLDLARVKQNTLGNTRMLKTL